MKTPLHITLYQPEIPPNTGNIIRLCANTGAELHLIHPLGFQLADKALRRAGLDYHEFAHIKQYENFAHYLEQAQPKRLISCTTKSSVHHTSFEFQLHDHLLFGPETRGLPPAILESEFNYANVRIPMKADSRSLNLSNATAVILYEALRQLNFPDLQ